MQLSREWKPKEFERGSGGKKRCVGVAFSSVNTRSPHTA